jgi:hypothetical protein
LSLLGRNQSFADGLLQLRRHRVRFRAGALLRETLMGKTQDEDSSYYE